jgi:hypothetical protein
MTTVELPAEAVEQAKAAILEVLRTGFAQDLEERDEPGLSERTKYLAGRLRSAYLLLGGRR